MNTDNKTPEETMPENKPATDASVTPAVDGAEGIRITGHDWLSCVESGVRQLCIKLGRREFSMDEFRDACMSQLAARYPSNNHPEEAVLLFFQRMRDDHGLLRFKGGKEPAYYEYLGDLPGEIPSPSPFKATVSGAGLGDLPGEMSPPSQAGASGASPESAVATDSTNGTKGQDSAQAEVDDKPTVQSADVKDAKDEAGQAKAEKRGGGPRRVSGIVIGNKADKTARVRIERRVKHALYGKIIRRRTHLQAHDADNKCNIGDVVTLEESPRFSKTKSWRVIAITPGAEVRR